MARSYVRRHRDVAAGGDALKEVDQNVLLCLTALLHLRVCGRVHAFGFPYSFKPANKNKGGVCVRVHSVNVCIT